MKKRNRILALLLTVVMLAGMLPTAAFATAEPTAPEMPTVSENQTVQTPAEAEPEALDAEVDSQANIGAVISGDQTWNDGDVIDQAVTISGTAAITVIGTVTMKAGITVTGGTVTFAGGGKLKRDASFTTGTMLTVSAGDVTLNAVTLDGGMVAGTESGISAGILVSGGTLTMNANSVLQNSKNLVGQFSTGGVTVTGGAFTLAGGTITGNVGYDGAGVLLRGGTFTMTDGEISKNIASGYCGGVYSFGSVGTPVTATMTGGVIEGNFVSNTASGGGGVMIHNYSTAKIRGTAKIINNGIANSAGTGAAGVWLFGTNNCTLQVANQVQITGNTIGAEATGEGTGITLTPGARECNVLLVAGKTIAIDTTPADRLTGAAKIGIYTATAPSDSADVQIATGAAKDAAQHFFSDNATTAGVLFCDGTNDWTNGVQMATNSEGHTHAEKTLWLSTAAKQQMDVYVKSDGADTNAGLSNSPLKTLAVAYARVADGGTIHVMDDLTQTAIVTMSAGKNITILSDDNNVATTNDNFIIKREIGFADPVLSIVGAGHITLKNITLDGQGGLGSFGGSVTATSPLILVTHKDGAVTLGDGAVLQNAKSTNGIAGIYLEGAGKLTIAGGTIQYCEATGVIEKSSASAVYVRGSDTEFYMTSGYIINNSGAAYAALTFYKNTKSADKYVISGGTIRDNVTTLPAGTGGILSDTDGQVTITGGTISNNIGPKAGGLCFWLDSSKLYLGTGSNITIEGNKKSDALDPTNVDKQVPNNLFLNQNTVFITINSALNGTDSIGVSTGAIPTVTPGTGDVKIATGAVSGDAKYFLSDNATNAGIIFCDGTHDWVRGKRMDTDSTGHVHAGNANTLWLSLMAASIDAPTVEVVSVTGVNIGNLSENLTAQMKITNYNATGVKYYYSVNGGAKAEIPTPTVESTNATFPLSGLKYGDNVQVWVENTTTLAVGSKATAKILDTALRNGGFENSTYAWRTTASDKAIEINPHGVYRVPVVEGRYCAELNANIASSLYQEIKTTSGETFTRALQHAGRMGTDVMALIIGPASADGSYGTATKVGDKDFFQTLVVGMASADKVAGKTTNVTVDGKVYEVTIISDGKGAWKNYPGEYVIPANQPATVFAFTSISSTPAGNPALGNLLDGVSFSSLPLEVNARLDSTTGHGQIEVKAVVGGKYTLKNADGTALTPADFAKFGITIKDKNGNVITPANDYTCSDDNKDTAPWTFDVPAGSKYQVGVYYASTDTGIDREVTIPGVGGNLTGGITGESPKEKATIIVDPADPRLKYGIVDENGNPVAAPNDGWKIVKDGKVVFEGLDPNTKYKVVTTTVAEPKPDPEDVTITTEVTTPKEPLPPIDPGKTIITRDPDEDTEHEGSDKITIKPVKDDLDYGVFDPETGDTVWLSGKDKDKDNGTDGDALEFHPLVPGREYEIVTRVPAGTSPVTDPSVPGPSITVPGSQTADPDKVKPGVTEDGKSSIKVFPTDPNTKYAVVDKNTGEVVSPITGDTDGWLTGDPTNPLVFAPLTPGGDYVVVTQPKNPADPEGPGEGGTGTGIYPTTDPAPIGPSITIPGVKLPGQVTAQPDPADPTNKVQITIQPSDPDYYYAVTDEDGNVVGGAGGWKEGKGKAPALVFPGLDPNTEYKVITLPKKGAPSPLPGEVTIDPGTGTTTTAPTGGLVTDITAPKKGQEPLISGGVGRIPGTGVDEGKDKIIINPTTSGTEYGIIDPITGDEKWVISTGDPITFQPLDPNREYQVTTRIPGTPPSLITPPVTVPVITVKPGVTAEGKGSITVNPTDKNTKYALVDEAGNVQVLDPEKDKDGWLTGTGGTLTFAPTVIGKKYQVITLPVDAEKDTDAAVPGNDENTVYPDKLVPTDGKTKPNPVGPTITAPDVTEEQIKGEIVPGTPKSTATITIQPSDPDLKYAVVDESGNVIGGAEGWQIGTGKGGAALEFKPLDPDTKYFVVTVGKDTVTTDKVTLPDGAGIKTPTDPAGDPNLTIDPDAIDRVHIATGPDAGKDKITVPNPGAGYEVAVIDPATGKVVAPIKGSTSGWIPGENGGGDLTFQPLDPNKGYEVVIRPTDPDNLVVPVRPGVTVPTISTGGNGGGGGGGTTTGVTVPKHTGGSTTISPANPKPGEEVIITITPDKGYVLDKLTVKDPKGNELTVTPMGGGKYKVTMPDPAVKLTVDATFKKLSNDPHNNGVSDLLNVDDHIAYMKGRSGGKFAPADNMTRAEVAQMFYNLLKTQDTNLGNKASYNDVPADAWYAKAVNTLANMGIVKGVGAGGFAPERTITRAEFIAIAARFANAATGGDTFSDVPATHWAFAEITTATAYGWISGYGDGSFKPGANIARSEAVKVVNAMLARSADKSFVDAATNLVTFSDVPTTDWAYYPIIEATNAHNFTTKDSAETWSAK